MREIVDKEELWVAPRTDILRTTVGPWDDRLTMFDASLVVNDCGDVLESMGMLAEAPVLLLGVPGLVKIVVETTRVPEMASALVPK